MKQTPLSLSLSLTHKAPWSRRMEAGDMVAARFGRNRAVSAISARIGPVRHKPARISTQQKKKWHGCMSAASPHQCAPGAGAAAPALHLCFLVAPTTILHNKTFNLSWILIFHGISHKHYSDRKSLSSIKRGLQQWACWEKREDGISAY